MKNSLLFFCFVLIISCNKNSVNTSIPNNIIENSSIAPNGLKIDSTYYLKTSAFVSISWTKININDYKSIKIYRGTLPNTTSLLTTISATENRYLDSSNINLSTVYYYRISAINNKDKESNLSNEISVTTPSLPTSRSSFELNGVTNLVLATSASNIFEYGNVLALDSNGNSSSLKIPDAKSYNLIVNYMVPCTKNLLYMNGTLTVNYNSGKNATYRNFILDTKTGLFFQLENDFGTLWSAGGGRKTPWVNGSIQYDANDNIYISTKASNIIQEMTKFSFLKTSDTSIRVTTSVFNLISGYTYYNYFILPSGDILYTYAESNLKLLWKMRLNSGNTIDMPLIQDGPLIIDGKTYFSSINTAKCFMINSSTNQAIIFVNGNPDQNTSQKYMPFYIKINGSNVTLLPVGAKYFNAQLDRPIKTRDADLFTDLIHGMWYFPKGSDHIFTNRGYGADTDPSTWWKYDEIKNDISVAFMPFSPFEFTDYSNLTTRSYDNAFVVIKRDIYNIDLNNFQYKKTPSLDYQIYLTSYVGDGRVQFYGISYLNGKKMLGEFSKDGIVKVIKEFDNAVTIKDIIKIGRF